MKTLSSLQYCVVFTALLTALLPLSLLAQFESIEALPSYFCENAFERYDRTIKLNRSNLNLRNTKTHQLDSIISSYGLELTKTEFILNETEDIYVNFRGHRDSTEWNPYTYIRYLYNINEQPISRTYHSLIGIDSGSIILDGTDPLTDLKYYYDNLGRHIKTTYTQVQPDIIGNEVYLLDTLTYDNDGRLFQILQYTQIFGELKLVVEQTHNYDDENNLQSIVSYELFQELTPDAFWGKSDSIVLNYLDNCTERQHFNWRRNVNAYIPTRLCKLEYNSDDRISTVYESYNFSEQRDEWNNIEKSIYEYSTDGNLELFQNYFLREFGLDQDEEWLLGNLYQVDFKHNDSILFEEIKYIRNERAFSTREPYVNSTHHKNLVELRETLNDMGNNPSRFNTEFYYSLITTSNTNYVRHNEIKLSPNPVSDLINFSGNSELEFQFTAYNHHGMKVLDMHKYFGDFTIDVSGLSSGVYIYNISSEENKVHTGVFLKL